MKNIITTAILMITMVIWANTINIPTDYTTIQEGIDASVDGDTVLVQPGTYVENINYNKNIVVGSLMLTTGDTSYISQTIIDGNQNGNVISISGYDSGNAVLLGFTVTNGYAMEEGAGIWCRNSIIEYCIIKNNVSETIGGGMSIGGTLVKNCIIKNNICSGSGGGIEIQGNATIENCLIINNESYWGAGINFNYNSNSTINNCTIINNVSEGGGGGINFHESSPTVSNSILNNNSPDELYILENGNPTITYSNIQGGWEGDGNIDANSLFCNISSGNYSLAENSPCVGTGENGVNMGAFDVGCAPIALLTRWNISANGSDEIGDGTEENPFATIQRGIDICSDGDTVLVWPGTYVENINYNGKNISVGSLMLTTGDTSYISQTIIEGQGLDGPWWENETVLFESQEDSSVVFQGFTIKNGTIAAKQYNFPYGSSPTITDLIIDNGIVNSWSAPTILLENSTIHNTNTSDGLLGVVSLKNCKIYNNTAQYFNTTNQQNLLFENCLIYNNTFTSTETAFESGGSTFINCTIVNNTIEGIGGIIQIYGWDSFTTTIINSIIWNNSPCIGFPEDPITTYCGAGQINYIIDPVTYEGQTGLVITNSIVMGINASEDVLGLVIGENVSSTHPALSSDFFPTEESSVIGLGIDSVLLDVWVYVEGDDQGMGDFEPTQKWFYAPEYDIDGNPRPNPSGSNPDIGVYESPLAEPQLPYTIETFETEGSIQGGLTMLDDNTLYAVSSNDKVYRLDGNLNYYYFLDVDGEIKSASTVTSDHNVYIASTDQNMYSFNASGITNDDWPRAMGSEVTASVAVDGDGNLYVGTENGIFQAVSPANESLWASNLGASVYASACISEDNKLYIPISDGRIICYNLNTINPASPMFEWLLPTGSGIVSSPALDSDGNIYVGTLDGRLLKIHNNGNSGSLVWEVATGDSIIASPILDGDGNVLVGSKDGSFYSISPDGVINWTVEAGGSIRSTAAIGGNGHIYFGSDDYKLYAVDSTGTVQWNYYAASPISSPILAQGNQIYFGEENGLVVKLTDNSARTTSRNQPMWGTFQGNNKRTGSQSDSNLGVHHSSSMPTHYSLHQNYPNPFNPITTIQYDLPGQSQVEIVIFDIMGREVRALVNQKQDFGYKSVVWDATNNLGQPVSAGMYLYRISAGDFHQVKKMILLK